MASGNIFTTDCLYVIGLKHPSSIGCTQWLDQAYTGVITSVRFTDQPMMAKKWFLRKDATEVRKYIEERMPSILKDRQVKLIVQAMEVKWRVTNNTPVKFLRGAAL